MGRHELTDAEWARLAPPLPPRRPRTGRPARDHRAIANALLRIARTGAPWRDLPERYGPWRTAATRSYRWTRAGVWRRVLAELRRQEDAAGRVDWSVHMVDGTGVRAHRHAAGARGGGSARRSAAPAAASRPSSACAATGGAGPARRVRPHRGSPPRADRLRRADDDRRGEAGRAGPPPAAARLRPGALPGDRGYTGGPVRAHLRRRGIAAVIPQLATERRPRLMDWQLYRERNVVERLVGRLEEHRRIATRYDKLAASYLAFVHLAAIGLRL